MQHLFLTARFYGLMIGIGLMSAIGAWVPIFATVATVLLVLFVLFILVDLALLWQGGKVLAQRKMATPLSLGDDQKIVLLVENKLRIALKLDIYDELPFPLQLRSERLRLSIKPKQTLETQYFISPKTRGEYSWGHAIVLARTVIGLLQRRFTAAQPQMTPVYPSVLQMKKMEIIGFRRNQEDAGDKRLSRMGQSYEFDRIKNYVQGDDVRHINWKATSRRNELMVNQYIDERSQNIVCVLDKSRAMNMPFNGMSLLDHSINASLALSNVAIKRGDKAGLLSFGYQLGNYIAPDNTARQMKLILEALYAEKWQEGESNFEVLHRFSSRVMRHRSLLLLFTNFESMSALERQLPLLKLIRNQHLLVVVLFINTEIEKAAASPVETISDIYLHTTAKSFLQDKTLAAQHLNRQGIHTILCRPEDLSVQLINKYVDLKSKFLI